MAKKYGVVVFFFVFLLACKSGWAHHPAGLSSTGYAGPIKTISATPAVKGRLSVSAQTEFINLSPFSDDRLREFAASGKDAHSVDSVFHSILGIDYGVSDDFTFSLNISYEHLNNIKEVHEDEPEEIHRHGDAKGMGDLMLLGQYRFLKRDSDFESSLLFGLRVPTGRTSVKDIEGERFETEFQPGTGSWNPIIGFAATKRFGQFSLDGSLLYTMATKGAQDTDLGDIFDYSAAFSYRAFRDKDFIWDLILEANGQWRQKQEVGGLKDENSGENVIFIAPGIRFSWKGLSAYLSYGVPAVQDLNGIQNKTRSRTIFGVSVSF